MITISFSKIVSQSQIPIKRINVNLKQITKLTLIQQPYFKNYQNSQDNQCKLQSNSNMLKISYTLNLFLTLFFPFFNNNNDKINQSLQYHLINISLQLKLTSMTAVFEQWKDSTGLSFSSAMKKKLEHFSYNLSDAIGKGYSSQVFKGRNDLTNHPVAIKVINMSMLKSEVHQTLLASEIDCLRKLSRSSNIIELFQVYTTKNNTYIITQLCENGDLSKLIQKKKMPQQSVIPIATQLIAGYTDIWKKGILHRDLKPANIFIKGDVVKIADFGFAVRIEDVKKNSNYNVGSPLYMPPEALNQNRYSYKSDIWALGIIIFEMLTGKAPWKAKTQKQLAKKILAQPIQGLIPSQISPAFVDFLTRTLQSDINLRMTPEQLQNFSFSSSPPNPASFDSKIGTKVPFHQRTQSLLRSSRNVSKPRIQIQTPKNMSMLLSSGQTSTSTRKQNINSFRAQQKTERLNRREISNQLLSEVHFCRFLYKLITRMQETNLPDVDVLKGHFACIIMTKITSLSQLESFNSYQLQNYKQYKETSDFKKIASITRQYEEKYKDIFQKYNAKSKDDYDVIIKQLIEAIQGIFSNLQCQITDNQSLGENKQRVIVLDYLITAYQLISLAALRNLSEFNKKSKIEAVVEGNPTKLGLGHIRKIREKLQMLQLV